MAKKKDKPKMGAPTKYKVEYNDQVYKLCLLGMIDEELAAFFEVDESTINNWKIAHPDFLESIKKGKIISDANVTLSLYKKATGYSHIDTKFATHEGMITDQKEYTKHYPPDTTAGVFWLKNRQPNKWRDKKEVDIKLDTANLTDDELDKEIKDLE